MTTTTTNTTIKKLMNTSDPDKTTRFVEDLKNLARRKEISGLVTIVLVPASLDGTTPEQSTQRPQGRGNLGRLLTHRVFPKIEGEVVVKRSGSEGVCL